MESASERNKVQQTDSELESRELSEHIYRIPFTREEQSDSGDEIVIYAKERGAKLRQKDMAHRFADLLITDIG